MLMRIFAEERPRHVFIGWDTLGVDTYRNKLWPPYQSGRTFDESIVRQLSLLPDICRAFGFGVGKAGGYEADDLMASAALKEVAEGGTALILTTDKDSYQLVSTSITVISPQRSTRELDRIGPDQVKAIFGVAPELVPDFKALAGDASDKIPGLKGCGPKTAAAMLQRHGSLEKIIAAGAVGKGEQLLMFREVARMRPDVEVSLPDGEPDWRRGSNALRQLGLDSLAKRVEGFA